MTDLICIDATPGRVWGDIGLIYLGRYSLVNRHENLLGGTCQYCHTNTCASIEVSGIRYATRCERRFVRAPPDKVLSTEDKQLMTEKA